MKSRYEECFDAAYNDRSLATHMREIAAELGVGQGTGSTFWFLGHSDFVALYDLTLERLGQRSALFAIKYGAPRKDGN